MLITREPDINVDLASTICVVNTLNKIQKDYELLFMPRNRHGVELSSKYVLGRLKDLLVKHLLGTAPPDWNVEERDGIDDLVTETSYYIRDATCTNSQYAEH